MSGRRAAATEYALRLVARGLGIGAAARGAGVARSTVKRAMRADGHAPRRGGKRPKQPEQRQ